VQTWMRDGAADGAGTPKARRCTSLWDVNHVALWVLASVDHHEH
jgi:hypothetical protein